LIGSIRLAARLAAMLVALLLGLVLHGTWRVLRLSSPWPRHFLGTVARIAGARPTLIGTPLRRKAFFVANHQSWLDILLLAGATGTAFVAKGELAHVPLVGWLCRLNHTIFVDRADRGAIAAQVADVRAALESGWSVAIFPEGTTGDGAGLLPFKAPLLSALEPPPPRVRVQPVWIDYGAATSDIAWVGEEHGLANVLRILRRPGGIPVTLHLLAPFDPAAVGNRKAIAAEARARIEAAMAG
jgi:1-acyl-sn-glycerol-3-phosphate acyltransferase